jgi:hypothetical protein
MFMVLGACALLSLCSATTARAAGADDPFQRGTQAYVAGIYDQAAKSFAEAAAASPAAGTLQNLGNAQWQCGKTGPAVLAWERSLWLNPLDANTRLNLRFARKAAQLDAPDLAWYEVCSAWLPVNSWAWMASISLWLAVAMLLLPAPLRWRRADWHQGVAAACFAVFLLTLPAMVGIHARSKIGIILPADTPLRLTPTAEAQVLTHVPAGETARIERERGAYVFIRTAGAAGWVERSQFGLISCSRDALKTGS